MSPNAVENDMAEQPSLEAIAICGMSCRLPGGVDSPSSFWNMLIDKRTGQTPKVPASRFNIDAHYHNDLDRPGSFNVLGGYFLDGNPHDFDASFFNVTPIEAQWLDPQQRRMLEVSYECLESAGITLDQVAGSNTAVFVGSFTADYQQMSTLEPDFRHSYAATGVDPGLISNRIGNILNLNGPNFTINTACSSSIYALHYACNALRAKDCEAAIVGGVNLILTVDQHMNTAKLGVLSPTSTCHTFDASADGYGRAEGAGALYVKRLSDAIKDGNPIRAIIRATAVNSNGKVDGMGITHPSGKGQERVVRLAYEKAGLDPRLTLYAELHGTGTPVGDPIEVKAISKALNDNRSENEPLLVGAVKPNIGHSEAASGIFAVMKAALMTEAAVIPGVALFNQLNPEILAKDWNVKVHADTAPWPANSLLRRASVSSFGYGGTNGHVIVESVENLLPFYKHGARKANTEDNHSTSRSLLLCFSAHDKPTLSRNIAAIKAVASEYYAADLAHTLNLHRTKFSSRGFTILREGREESSFRAEELRMGTVPKNKGGVGFIFTGQGAQWAGMGKIAMAEFPLFQETIERLDRVLSKLDPNPTFTLSSILSASRETDSDRINEADVTQPLCTAIQIALVDLFTDWNIAPSVSIGHSSGEIAAAYAAGLISAPEAIIAAFARGIAVRETAGTGSMLAVGLGANDVAKWLPTNSEEVCIACENSPNSVTLSGNATAISELARTMKEEGIFAQELNTGRAYHSPYMAAVGEAYDVMLPKQLRGLTDEDLSWRQPRSPMISSVTGKVVVGDTIPLTYWSTNLRERVLFDTAVRRLALDEEFDHVASVIEVGCHSALARAFKQNNPGNRTYIPSLQRGKDDADQLLAVAGSLFLVDYPVDLQEVNIDFAKDSGSIRKSAARNLLVDLPPYQWNYEKQYWAEPRASAETRSRTHARHDLLGTRVPGLSHSYRAWRNILRHRDIPWLKEHNLGGEAVFPAAGYLSVAIEALRQIHEVESLSFEGVSIRDVDIKTALVIPEGDGIEIMACMHTTDDQDYTFTLESMTFGQWTLHCKGRISATSKFIAVRNHPVDETALTQRVSGKRWYDVFRSVGFNYTNTFQRLLDTRTDRSLHHAACNLIVSQTSSLMTDESRYMLHPSSLDACLQLIIIAINAGKHREMQWGVVPTHIKQLLLTFPEGEAESTGHAVAWSEKIDDRHFDTHACLTDSTGKLIMNIDGLTCTAYEAVLPPRLLVPSEPEPFSMVSWKPDIEMISADAALGLDSSTDLVELICHKQPIKSILICGSPSLRVMQSTLDILPKNCTITVGFAEEQQVPFHIDERLQERMTVKVSPEEWLAGTESSQFDLLIADYSGLVNPSATVGVESLVPLIRTGGWLVGAQCHYSSLPRTIITSKHHFAYRQTDAEYLNDVTSSNYEISLVSLGYSNSNSASLSSALTGSGKTVYERRSANFVVSDREYIVIDDRQGTALLSPTESDFSNLKTLLASGLPLLWLTQGVQEGYSAEGGLAEGFLRVLRSEQASLRAVLLDVDHDESINNVAQTIISRLDIMSSLSSSSDTEFWLHDGVLRISRLYPYAPQPAANCQEEHSTAPITLPFSPGLAIDSTATEAGHIQAKWVRLTEPSPNTTDCTSALAHIHSKHSASVDVTSEAAQLAFSDEGVYVLVGCLGGLGRSLTKWMMEHGARHFAFISRSGASKPEAARVIASIQKCPGTSTRVFRADAADEAAMRCIIYSLQAERPIRGVIHAAMVLKDGMFEQMDHASYMAAIVPKVHGALSLHKALGSAQLDFFVMTSSVSAVLGNMGQSNYSAANSFLDALARHRTATGLAATSLALPMVLDVGVVAEDDAIEASLLRKGLYGISEDEMLGGIATAINTRAQQQFSGTSHLTISSYSHLVMGMEVREISSAIASIKADNMDPSWLNNARFCHLQAAVKADTARGGSNFESKVGTQEQGFATTLETAQTQGPEAVVTVIATCIMERMSGILMIPVNDFEVEGPSLGSYGLDSMVGTEMRSWLFKEFGLDYSFQKLLSKTLTFRALATVVANKLGVLEASGDK